MNLGVIIALLLAQAGDQPSKRLDLSRPPVIDRGEPTYRLEREKGGFIYRGARFDAHIAVDGTVSFADKGSSKPALPLPMPLPKGTPTLSGVLMNWLAQRRHRPTPAPAALEAPPQSTWYSNPNWASTRELCQDYKSPCFLDQRGVIMTGIFADWDLYLVGMPKKAAGREEKARFLAATALLRTRMAEQAHAENLEAAQWDLPALLQRIWSDSKQSPTERRQLLLELWREYAEMADNETSCAIIIAYIRRHLPAGSPDAYTANELSRVRSDAGPRFDPYGP